MTKLTPPLTKLVHSVAVALPLAGVVPFPHSPHPYLAMAPGAAQLTTGPVALFHQPAFGPRAQVGVLAAVHPDGDVLECQPVTRVRSRADGGLESVRDAALSADDAAAADRLHSELWQLLGELAPAASPEPARTLAALRPGVGSASVFSLALAAVCELEPHEQQRLLETVSTLDRLAFLRKRLREAASIQSARRALARLQIAW
jgi:hypothetical protein